MSDNGFLVEDDRNDRLTARGQHEMVANETEMSRYRNDRAGEDTVSGPGLNHGETVTAKRSNPLSDLKATLSKTVQKAPIVLPVPGRPGITMRFETDLELELLTAYQKKATKTFRGRSNMNDMQLATLVLTKLSSGLLMNGEEVFDDAGEPLGLWNVELANMLGVLSTQGIEVLRGLYGFDGHILHTFREVMTAAGYGDDLDLEEVDSENSTMRS